MQRRLVVNDVSGQPIGPIFKGPAVQENGIDILFFNLIILCSAINPYTRIYLHSMTQVAVYHV